MRNYFISSAGALVLSVLGGHGASAEVLYSGGNPWTRPDPNPPGSTMAWNFFSSSSYWSKPYVGAVVAAGDEWTVTGFEFYAAMGPTADPVTSVLWDIRTTATNLDPEGLVTSGSTSEISYVDSGLNMTWVYDFDIYKFTVTLETPVVLAGGETYYFSTMLNRMFADSVAVAIVFSDGTGTVGVSPETLTNIWNQNLGYSPMNTTSNLNLAFSIIGTRAIPEPTSLGMLAAGAFAVAYLRRRKVAGRGGITR